MFFATTVNYVDRQVFGILGPGLTEEFYWSESDFSFIVNAFTLAYAIGYVVVGRIMDRIGVRKGFALAVGLWSGGDGHGLVRPLVYCGTPWLDAALRRNIAGTLTPAVVSR